MRTVQGPDSTRSFLTLVKNLKQVYYVGISILQQEILIHLSSGNYDEADTVLISFPKKN